MPVVPKRPFPYKCITLTSTFLINYFTVDCDYKLVDMKKKIESFFIMVNIMKNILIVKNIFMNIILMFVGEHCRDTAMPIFHALPATTDSSK